MNGYKISTSPCKTNFKYTKGLKAMISITAARVVHYSGDLKNAREAIIDNICLKKSYFNVPASNQAATECDR